MPRNHLHSPALFAIFIMVIGLGFCISGPEDILVELLILVSILRENYLSDSERTTDQGVALLGRTQIYHPAFNPSKDAVDTRMQDNNTQLSQLFFSWPILANLIEFRHENRCPFNSRRLNFYFSHQGANPLASWSPSRLVFLATRFQNQKYIQPH